MSRGYLTKFDFDGHELWDKLHCRDQSAFLESKTCEQLLTMTRKRGIRDSQVFSYGHRSHKKTYISALREIYLIDAMVKMQERQTIHPSLIHPDLFNGLKSRFEESEVNLNLIERENSDLKTTNIALYEHVQKMEKKLKAMKGKYLPGEEMERTCERMCKTLSINLAELAKERDEESVRNDALVHALADKTKMVVFLQRRVSELSELQVCSRTKEKATSIEDGLEILNVLRRNLKRQRRER